MAKRLLGLEGKPAHSPAAGLVMLPLQPSPGGVGNLLQTSISRDISNSLIASRERRGGCLSMWAPVGGLCGESRDPAAEILLGPTRAAHPGSRLGPCPPTCTLGVRVFRALGELLWASLCLPGEPQGLWPVCVWPCVWLTPFRGPQDGLHSGVASAEGSLLSLRLGFSS